MPEIAVRRILSSANDDPSNPCANLLDSTAYKKWLGVLGAASVNCILQLSESTNIDTIEIGNANSAFVEISVGRQADNTENWEVLLPTSALMTPTDSRNVANGTQVRSYQRIKGQLQKIDNKFDQIKITCTQPFNKRISYGLSFIKFWVNKQIIEKAESQNQTTAENLKFGPFALIDTKQSNKDLLPGSLFSHRNVNETTTTKPTTSMHEIQSNTNPISPDTQAADKPSPVSQASVGKPAIPKLNTTQSTSTVTNDSQPTTSKIAIQTKRTIAKRPARKVPTNKNKRRARNESDSDDYDRLDDFIDDEDQSLSEESFESESSGDSMRSYRSDRSVNMNIPKKKPTRTVAFDQLLAGVTIVISGIENPERTEIRTKAIEIGAQYSPSWNAQATHLVAAFRNTPKVAQVRGTGAKIVTRHWINKCYEKRRKLYWRYYALDVHDRKPMNNEESEEELIAV